jgi:diacylglycerol kinase family enzyme
MTASSFLFVANPTAQSGKNAARIERALAWMANANVACEMLATLPEGKTIAAVTGALDRGAHTGVIAMGGDGTFREVAAGLLGSARREDVALGMLPTGTANDQGRSFGLEATDAALERNLRVILDGNETRLDAGRLRGFDAAGRIAIETAFFDSAGWGISARVLAARNQDRKWVQEVDVLRDVYRDQLVYAGALLRTFVASYVVNDKFTADIVADGRDVQLAGLTDLVVKGTRIYGGAWVFDRTSKHDDGLFEVIPFRGKRDWTSKAIVDLDGNPVTEEMLNAVGVEHSKGFRAAKLDIRFVLPEGGAPHAAQIDGEELVATPRVTIDVEPRAIRLIVPG